MLTMDKAKHLFIFIDISNCTTENYLINLKSKIMKMLVYNQKISQRASGSLGVMDSALGCRAKGRWFEWLWKSQTFMGNVLR